MKHGLMLTAAFSFTLFGAAGCMPSLRGTVADVPMSEAQAGAVLKAMEQPLTFEVSKAAAPDDWGRAQAFVAQHASMKIQTLSDAIIQTYAPTLTTADMGFNSITILYGYTITKSTIGDRVRISVECVASPCQFKKDQIAKTASRNAHLAAHFIKTGELPYPELVIK